MTNNKAGSSIMETDLDLWGMEYVTINNDVQMIRPSGYANARWKIRHNKKSAFPIGSNTKTFASVALFQLDEMGVIDVTKSISDYLDVNDLIAFGYNFENNIKLGIDNDTYCPIIINSNSTECETITFIDLLTTNTGIVNALNCPFRADPLSPFTEYCWDFCDIAWQPYLGNVTFYIETFINAPLKYEPGVYDYNTTTHDYSNPNYLLIQYFIEKYSSLSFGNYIEQYIAKPLGLKNTYFDPFDGSLGINRNRIDEYLRIPGGEDKKYKVGKCVGADLGFLGGAGGMVSTNEDMHKFYYHLFSKDTDKSLIFQKNDTIKRMIYPYVLIGDTGDNTYLYFAAGILVTYQGGHNENRDWPIQVGFRGSTLCTYSRVVARFGDDYQRMLIMSVFSNAPLFDYESIGWNYENDQFSYDGVAYSFCVVRGSTNPAAVGVDFRSREDELYAEWINSTEFVDGN